MNWALRLTLGYVALWFLAIFAAAFFHLRYFNVALISLVILILSAPRRLSLVWAIFIGIILEMYSPFPSAVYFTSVLITAAVLRLLSVWLVNRQTVLGAIFSGLVASAIFEISISALSAMLPETYDGWRPTPDFAYLQFVLQRALAAALLSGAAMFILRSSSPVIRGTIIKSY